MGSVVETLKDSKRADRIMIELTEEAFVAKGTFQNRVLPMLRESGVRVSIDDFGTGYSSLSALADITADELKIDRSFVSAIHERPRSQSVLRAIESLGRALGMTIVAEGVETFEELAYLQAATGIRQVQGFYFAKPFYLQDLHDCRAAWLAGFAKRARGQMRRARRGRVRAARRAFGRDSREWRKGAGAPDAAIAGQRRPLAAWRRGSRPLQSGIRIGLLGGRPRQKS